MIKRETRSVAPQFGNRARAKANRYQKSQQDVVSSSQPEQERCETRKFWYPKDLDLPDGGALVKPRQIQPEPSKTVTVTVRKRRDYRK